jgi:hypothetical protein
MINRVAGVCRRVRCVAAAGFCSANPDSSIARGLGHIGAAFKFIYGLLRQVSHFSGLVTEYISCDPLYRSLSWLFCASVSSCAGAKVWHRDCWLWVVSECPGKTLLFTDKGFSVDGASVQMLSVWPRPVYRSPG